MYPRKASIVRWLALALSCHLISCERISFKHKYGFSQTNAFFKIESPGSVDLSHLTISRSEQEFGSDRYLPLDIVVVQAPPDFDASTEILFDLDWQQRGLGLGRSMCCDEQLYQDGNCTDLNKIILDPVLFDGFHWHVSIAYFSDGSSNVSRSPPSDWIDIQESGWWFVSIIKCSPLPDDRAAPKELMLDGYIEVKSWYGYFPGIGEAFFVCTVVFSLISAITCGLYGFAMHKSENSHGAIEETIFYALVFATAAHSVETARLVMWNLTGEEFLAPRILGIILHSIKIGLGTFAVMIVTLGRGYTRPVSVLGLAFVTVSILWEFTRLITKTPILVIQVLSVLYLVLHGIIFALVIYACWRTMGHLRRANRWHTLRRYIWFFGLLVGTTVSFFVAFILVSVDEPIRAYLNSIWFWNEAAIFQGTFLLFLLGMAVLWWPDPSNRDYEQVFELSPLVESNGVESSAHPTATVEFAGSNPQGSVQGDMDASNIESTE